MCPAEAEGWKFAVTLFTVELESVPFLQEVGLVHRKKLLYLTGRFLFVCFNSIDDAHWMSSTLTKEFFSCIYMETCWSWS